MVERDDVSDLGWLIEGVSECQCRPIESRGERALRAGGERAGRGQARQRRQTGGMRSIGKTGGESKSKQERASQIRTEAEAEAAGKGEG